jgi:hypothetical protein
MPRRSFFRARADVHCTSVRTFLAEYLDLPLLVSLLQLMAQAFPAESLELVDANGDSPLLTACSELSRQEPRSIDGHCKALEVLANYEDTRPTKDRHGRTPLHVMCLQEVKPYIDVLLAKHPSWLRETDNDGQLPLYYAVYHYVSSSDTQSYLRNGEGIISSLLEAYSFGAYISRNDGVTPLQLAYQNDSNVSIFTSLCGSIRWNVF